MKNLSDILFPKTCLLCNRASKNKQDFCKKCYQDLPWIEFACPKCGQPLETNNQLCKECLKNPPIFEQTIALFHYKEPINHFITGLKFNNKLIYSRILGELMAEKISKHYQQTNLPEIIIPVPLHNQRLRQRGYNQAIELARPIAKILALPIDIKSCKRIKNTGTQSSIPAKQRAKNIKKAFTIKNKPAAKHVAIIDDVITTGNTIKELSSVLHKSGVQTIDIWCCAKTNLIF